MRIVLACCLACAMLLGCACAGAEIHMDQEPPAEWAEKDVLRLTAFQTKINDSALLEVGGKTMLIDGGVQKWADPMWKALAEMGYDGRVDILYNTHPHDDHLEAVTKMVKNGFRADAFYSNFPETYRNDVQRAAVKALKDAEIPYHQFEWGEELDFGGAHLTFYFWPEGMDPNAKSSALMIEFGHSSVLMTGDASGETARYYHGALGKDGKLKADILKIPHHGIVEVVASFMDDVAPGFAYVTNWMHSTPRVTRQLENREIPHYYTTGGRVVMVTDGEDWYIKQYKGEF